MLKGTVLQVHPCDVTKGTESARLVTTPHSRVLFPTSGTNFTSPCFCPFQVYKKMQQSISLIQQKKPLKSQSSVFLFRKVVCKIDPVESWM